MRQSLNSKRAHGWNHTTGPAYCSSSRQRCPLFPTKGSGRRAFSLVRFEGSKSPFERPWPGLDHQANYSIDEPSSQTSRPPNRKMQRLLPSGGSSTASQEVKSTRLSSAENEDDLSDGQSNFRSHTAQLSRELGARSVWCNARSSNDHSHSVAADYKQNPFSLVYGGAITKNELGKVNIHSVTYQLSGLDVVANAMFRAARCSAARRPYCCRLAGRMATRPPAIILGG